MDSVSAPLLPWDYLRLPGFGQKLEWGRKAGDGVSLT